MKTTFVKSIILGLFAMASSACTAVIEAIAKKPKIIHL